jgi:DNA segregation ATPase FtsK/SpoIIIE-like protein
VSNFEIIKTHLPDFKSFRVCSILGTFDLPKEEITERFSGEITLDDNWQIGVIYGTSGSGKSTIANQIVLSMICPKNVL